MQHVKIIQLTNDKSIRYSRWVNKLLYQILTAGQYKYRSQIYQI